MKHLENTLDAQIEAFKTLQAAVQDFKEKIDQTDDEEEKWWLLTAHNKRQAALDLLKEDFRIAGF